MVEVKFFRQEDFVYPNERSRPDITSAMTTGEMLHHLTEVYDVWDAGDGDQGFDSLGSGEFPRLNQEQVYQAWQTVLEDILEIGDQALIHYEYTGMDPKKRTGGIHSLVERLA